MSDPPPAGIYTIRNAYVSIVFDLSNGDSANGTPLSAWEHHAYTDSLCCNQLWLVEPVVGIVSTIRNLKSGTYLDLSGGSSNDGTPVYGWERTGSFNQQWVIGKPYESEYYKIENHESSTFLELYKGGSDNGNPIVGWTGRWTDPVSSCPHQLWTFERVSYTGLEIRDMIKENQLMHDSLRCYAVDRIYWVVNISFLMHIWDDAAGLGDGRQYPYRAEKFDCDNFAVAYKDTVAKWGADNLGADGFGLLCGVMLGKSRIPGKPNHAYNFTITDNTSPDTSPPAVLLLEPQNGKVVYDIEYDTYLAFF